MNSRCSSQQFLMLDLCLEEGKVPDSGISGVGAELGRKEALDPDVDGRLDQDALCSYRGWSVAQARNDGVLILQQGSELRRVLIVDCADPNGKRRQRGVFARQSLHLEAGVDKGVDDRGTNRAGDLLDRSVLLMLHVLRRRLTPATVTVLISGDLRTFGRLVVRTFGRRATGE